MKLRIKGNSIRVRLDRKDLEQLVDCGRIENIVRFGPDPQAAFSYSVELGSTQQYRPTVAYQAGRLVLVIDRHDAVAWSSSELLGFDHDQRVEGGVVRVLLEKDLACIDRPAGEEPDDAWAFPNPASVC